MEDKTLALYSLVRREDPKQYGPLDQMVSMFAHYEDWSVVSSTKKIQFFNGDTFITKYGLALQDESFYPWTNNDDQDQPYSIDRMIKPH